MVSTLSSSNSALEWDLFLNLKPVLWQARERLQDGRFILFLDSLSHLKWPYPVGMHKTLREHAFEQIGWPEGHSYTVTGTKSFALDILRLTGPNYTATMSQRLPIRVKHANYPRPEFIAAHKILQEALDSFCLANTNI